MVPRRYSSFEDFHKRYNYNTSKLKTPIVTVSRNSLKAESYGPLPPLPPKQQLGRFAPGEVKTIDP